VSSGERIFLGLYAVVAALEVAVCWLRDGASPDNLTRLAIIAFFALQLAWWWWRSRARAGVAAAPREAPLPAHVARAFILRGALGALVVEGCYMWSRPLYPSLLVTRDDSLVGGVRKTLIDFVLTFPVYVALFALIWFFVRRYRYRIAEYVVVFALAQACGDGNAFFVANPAMLLFAPWLMLNYQAMNLVPFLLARPFLASASAGGRPALATHAVRLISPLLAIPIAYWCLGTLLVLAGRALGLT